MDSRSIQILLWALPISISVHVFEEFAFPGRFIQWVKSHKPDRLRSNLYYVAVNAAAILGTAIIALKASDKLGYSLFLYFTALMAGNATSHIFGSIQKRQYCPGSLSGALLLLPLLPVSTWKFIGKGIVDIPSAALNVCIGFFMGFFLFSAHVRQKDRT